MKVVPLLLVSLALLSANAPAAEPKDVFFLAIGSRSYMAPAQPGVQGLNEIPGAAKSAKIVAELLRSGGAKYGLTLISDSEHFVGKDDVYGAFPIVWDEMVRQKTRKPLVVVYIAAHGVADGAAWYQFILPGNFQYRGDLKDLAGSHTIEMANQSIFVSAVVEYLMGWKVPFVLLIDTCYEGDEITVKHVPVVPDIDAPCPPNDIISFCNKLDRSPGMEQVRKAEKQSKEVEKIVSEMFLSYREANKFKNAYPVMFSTEPGRAVPTVADPDDAGGTAIAPLARRMMLVLHKGLEARQSLSLGSFIRGMASPSLDKQTSPGVIYSTLPPGSDDAILVDGSSPGNGKIETRLGTAKTPVVCCGE